ncbi:metal tolerance protein 10-like [Quercus lobata]|uniref:metal tolerance protein 10-like n=1 Tax=Quercus lobata TaxID=97700 RepID=UPI00124412C6|nr:metal tolerance protein 10-like [Quercus lobata]
MSESSEVDGGGTASSVGSTNALTEVVPAEDGGGGVTPEDPTLGHQLMVYFKQVYGNPFNQIDENGQRTRCNSSLEDELRVQDDDETKQLPKSVRMAIYVTNTANIVLFAAKVFDSIERKSLAVIASILAPLFDLLWGFILWFTSHAMQNPNQRRYPIGKKRMQPVGIIIFGSFGLQVLFQAAQQFITKSVPEKDPQKEKWIIGIMTSVTLVKFMLVVYCRRFKNKIVRAYAEHHFSDVKTNLISLAAVVLASRYYWWIDPTGAIIILLYTMNTWKKTFIENLFALIGRTAPPEFLGKLTYLIWNHHEDVKKIDTVRAYTFGSDHYFVEVDIVLPQDMVLSKTHDIGETLQEKLEQLPEVARAFVHIDSEYTHRPEHKTMV